MRPNRSAPATKTSHLSELNRRRVIDALLESKVTSRRQIAERTRLAPSTVSTITGELLEDRFIQRVGKRDQASVGRRQDLMARNPRAATVLAVHYTTDACTLGVVDFGLNVVDEIDLPLHDAGPESIHEIIVESVESFLDGWRDKPRPGGLVLSLPNHPVQEKVVTSRVAERLAIPVVGLNNVAAMAVYYNYISIEGESPRTFSLVYVGSGIGSGLVLNGSVYHGVNGKASDLGHVYIGPSDIRCRCGSTGCVETFASLNALSHKVLQHFSLERRLRGDELVDFLSRKLESGDRFVRDMIDEACSDLAKAVRNLTSLLDPGIILIVSRLNRLNPFYEQSFRNHYYARSAVPAVQTTTLDFGEYRPEAGIVGAALFAYHQLLGGANAV